MTPVSAWRFEEANFVDDAYPSCENWTNWEELVDEQPLDEELVDEEPVDEELVDEK